MLSAGSPALLTAIRSQSAPKKSALKALMPLKRTKFALMQTGIDGRAVLQRVTIF
jgi:hypothetical protein